jgi:hypothetical protein
VAWPLSLDLTAAEIELSVVAEEAGGLAVPPLVPALVGVAAPPALLEPPERAAPPSMATAQPDSSVPAIIAMISVFAQTRARTCPRIASEHPFPAAAIE